MVYNAVCALTETASTPVNSPPGHQTPPQAPHGLLVRTRPRCAISWPLDPLPPSAPPVGHQTPPTAPPEAVPSASSVPPPFPPGPLSPVLPRLRASPPCLRSTQSEIQPVPLFNTPHPWPPEGVFAPRPEHLTPMCAKNRRISSVHDHGVSRLWGIKGADPSFRSSGPRSCLTAGYGSVSLHESTGVSPQGTNLPSFP